MSVAGRWQENIGEKQDVELLADACEVLAVDEEVNIRYCLNIGFSVPC